MLSVEPCDLQWFPVIFTANLSVKTPLLCHAERPRLILRFLRTVQLRDRADYNELQ